MSKVAQSDCTSPSLNYPSHSAWSGCIDNLTPAIVNECDNAACSCSYWRTLSRYVNPTKDIKNAVGSRPKPQLLERLLPGVSHVLRLRHRGGMHSDRRRRRGGDLGGRLWHRHARQLRCDADGRQHAGGGYDGGEHWRGSACPPADWGCDGCGLDGWCSCFVV